MEKLKVCKDCPLYTSRHLYNSSRTVAIVQGTELGSRQAYEPDAIVTGLLGTFPKVEIVTPPTMQDHEVANAIISCNEATAAVSGLGKVARIVRNTINMSRRGECPALDQLSRHDTQNSAIIER